MRAPGISIRFEAPGDVAAVAKIIHAAFGGESEVWLVDRLRHDGLVEIAMVADHDSQVVGHILLSRMEAEQGGKPLTALALAPVAASPRIQRSGIGSLLIEAGIAEAKRRSFDVIFVLGHPTYYPRFGFSAPSAVPFAAPFRGPAFMALPLREGVLTDAPGKVVYPSAFGLDQA